jgi:hypothetical protein
VIDALAKQFVRARGARECGDRVGVVGQILDAGPRLDALVLEGNGLGRAGSGSSGRADDYDELFAALAVEIRQRDIFDRTVAREDDAGGVARRASPDRAESAMYSRTV